MQNINTVTPEFKGTNFQPNTMAEAEMVNTPNSVIASDLTKLQDSLNECVQIINSPTIQEIDDTIHAIQTRIGDVEDVIEGDVYAPKNHSSSITDYGLQTEANYGHVKMIDNLTTTDTGAGKQLSARQGSIIKGLINGLQNEINVNQNEIDELQNEVDGIQTDINGIHGDIDGIHTDISGLQDDINSNTEEGNVIKGLINGLNSEVGGLQTEVGEIQSEISGLQTALDGKVDDSQVLTNVPLNAKFTDTVYNHPGTHPASMIAESTSRRFVSDTEKANWNAKWDYNENIIKAVKVDNAVNADTVNGKTVAENVPVGAKFTDTIYTHPLTSGNKHIPSGGNTNQILRYNADGTAMWSNENNTTYSEITTAEIDAGTASTDRTITGRRVKYILDKMSSMISVAIGALTKSSVGLGNVDNTSDESKPISTATQTALNGKVNNSQVLTNVPSGAKFTDTITTINGKTGAISKTDITALGIPAQDTVYSHPSSHPASMITESSTKRFVSDVEKDNWDNKAEILDIPTKVSQLQNDSNYVTQSELGDAGFGDMVKAVYDTNNNGVVDNAEKVNGFTVGTNVPANAKFTDTNTTYSEITTAEIDTGTASTLRTITGRRVKYILDKVQGWIDGIQNDIIGIQNDINELQENPQNLVTVDSNRVVRYNGKALYIPGTNTGTVETSASTSSVTLTVDISGIHEISLEGVGSRKAILLSTSPDPANINMGNVLQAHMKEDADMHKMQTFQGLIEKGETLYAYVTTNTGDYYYHDIAYLVEKGVFAVQTVDVQINVTHPIFIKAGSH